MITGMCRSPKGTAESRKEQASPGQQSDSSKQKSRPKPALTAYNVFQRDAIAEVRRLEPTKTFAEHSKLVGELWRAAPTQVKVRTDG